MARDDGEAADARPRSEDFWPAFARWAEAPTIDETILAQARMSAPPGASAERAVAAVRDGRRAEAVDGAIAALGEAAAGPERESLRGLLAAEFAAADRQAPEALFAEPAGWRPDAPFCPASLILFVELAGAAEGWCVAQLKRAGRSQAAPIRHAALVSRLSIAGRVGVEAGAFAKLAREIIEDRDAGRPLARRLAILGHSQDDRSFAEFLLARFPGLAAVAEKDAIVASLLQGVGGLRLSGEARRLADRLARTEAVSRDFWARLAAPDTRVAVVGNSPCALGRGLGPLIDRHDVVLRFNDCPEDGSFAQDYGQRCDVKMLNKPKAKTWARRTGAKVVLTRRRFAIGGTGALADELEGLGKSLAFVSGRVNQRLYAEIGRLPSSGILTLACLKEAKGSLASVSTFGFSFVDMLAGRRGAHYFGAKSAGRHDWLAERALYDAWTGENPPPVQGAPS